MPTEGITFERTYTATQADFWVDAATLQGFTEAQDNFFIRHTHQKFWFMDPDFVGRTPRQAWQIRLADMAIDVCNYATQRPVLIEEVDVIASSIARFSARFPLPRDSSPTAIAITDRLYHGTSRPQGYGEVGGAAPWTRSYALAIDDGALDTGPCDKNIPIPTNVAVNFHELTHFWWDIYLSTDWRDEGFTWEAERTPIRNRPRKKDGRVQYVPNRPEDCVTEYAKTAECEDIAESFTAYLGRAKHALHPAKRRILDREDYYLPPLEYEIKRQEPSIPTLPSRLTYVVANQK